MSQWDVETKYEAETEALGNCLAGSLFAGAVIGLTGPLGAGKTRLVRAIANGLNIADARVVNSPTFVLIQEYAARLPIYHFDAYRLKSEAEFIDLGAHEYFDGQGVCLIEWADRVDALLPADRLTIQMEITGETSRRLHFEAGGARHQALLTELAGAGG